MVCYLKLQLYSEEETMKRHFSISLMLVIMGMLTVTSSPVAALEDSPLSYGPKVGMNFSDFSGFEIPFSSALNLIDFRFGFCGGGFLSYAINDWFRVQTELLYSMKGLKLGFGDIGAGLSLDYIEIPLLAMLTIPNNSRFTPNLFVGPTIGFNVRAKAYGELGDLASGTVDISEVVNVFEAGMAFGGGLNVEIGPGELTFDIRYVLGFTDVFDSEAIQGQLPFDLPFNIDPSVSNSVITLMLGYGF